MESLTSKDDRDTVVEFSKKFRVTDKAAFGYSFAGMSNEFLVTLFESEKGTKLMHVDFRSTGEDHDTKRAYSHLLENRMDFEVIKAGIEYRNELEAYVTENSAQWKDKRVKLPASTFFSKDQDKTSTHSEPYFVTEVPLPFIPKFVRLTNEEAEAKKSLEELSFDLGRTLREYESKAATLRDALNADAFAEEAVASVSVH